MAYATIGEWQGLLGNIYLLPAVILVRAGHSQLTLEFDQEFSGLKRLISAAMVKLLERPAEFVSLRVSELIAPAFRQSAKRHAALSNAAKRHILPATSEHHRL